MGLCTELCPERCPARHAPKYTLGSASKQCAEAVCQAMYAQSVDTGVFCAACQIVRRNCFTEAVSWSTAQAVPHGHTAARAGGHAPRIAPTTKLGSSWSCSPRSPNGTGQKTRQKGSWVALRSGRLPTNDCHGQGASAGDVLIVFLTN